MRGGEGERVDVDIEAIPFIGKAEKHQFFFFSLSHPFVGWEIERGRGENAAELCRVR